MSQNELLAIALGIGRKLARQDWHKMSPAEAEQWCIKEAANRHVTSENEQRLIAAHAMNYVINGGN